MKGKKFFCGILVSVFMGSLPLQAFAAERAEWVENNMNIHMRNTDFQEYYEVDYLNVEQGQMESDFFHSINGDIYLLMIDGGFVPYPDLLLCENGTVHVPFDVIETPLQLTLQPQEENGEVTVKKEDLELYLHYSNLEVTEINGRVYVPLRYLAEAFGCEVGYISDYRSAFCNDENRGTRPQIRIITVETPEAYEKVYTKEEAMMILQKLSEEEYRQIKEAKIEGEQSFEGYDPAVIFDSGKELGRYDVYQLKGFEGLPIFFNRYTGEVFGSNPYTGLISVLEGFSDISKAI